MRLVAAALFLTLLPSLVTAQGPTKGEFDRARFELEFTEQPPWWRGGLNFLRAQVTGGIIRPSAGTTMTGTFTFYSPEKRQTDESPCYAAGGQVFRGMVAANWLPLGTQIALREDSGLPAVLNIEPDQFYVGDRMNRRYGRYFMDLWVPKTQLARELGRRRVQVTILRYFPRSDARKVLAEKFNEQKLERLATPAPTPKSQPRPAPISVPEELSKNAPSGFLEDVGAAAKHALGFLLARVGIPQEHDCFGVV